MVKATNVTIPEVGKTYPIRVGASLLRELGNLTKEVFPQSEKALIVTDSHVAKHYLQTARESLKTAGLQVHEIVTQSGEDHKTLETLNTLYDAAFHSGIKRSDVIIALGGGIVGDMTGLLAANYLRGVPFIQVPTTLLAQVDSSVGGKVAVNYKHLKNWIGAFYHPKAVLIDTDTLKTLPERDFACGMAEVIKYGLIEKSVPGVSQPGLFQQLLASNGNLDSQLSEIILKCCELKAAVVHEDPDETRGIREILNLGHTFGHAYETVSKGEIPHGEAVSMGCCLAFKLAESLRQIDTSLVEQVSSCFSAFGLPVFPPAGFPKEAILSAMKQDKKVQQAGKLRLVLPKGELGTVVISNDISAEQVSATL